MATEATRQHWRWHLAGWSCALACVLGMSFVPMALAADPQAGAPDSGEVVKARASDAALWVNPGLYSVHFEDNGYNDNNYGIGLEYRYSDTQSVTAGGFKNSDYKTSRYLAWYWQPFAIGPVKLGATLGVMDGYPNYHHGDWFLAAIPALTYEAKRWGVNVLFTPDYEDRLHGALSFQLKLRLW